MPGVMTPASSFSTSSRWARLRALPAAAPAAPSATAPATMVAGRNTAATTPPTIPHLSPVRVLWSVIFSTWIRPSSSGLDDEDAVDVERAVELGRQQVVVDRAGRRRVGEARDDERVVALDRDRALGQDALVVGDGAGHHDRRRRRWRACSILVRHVRPPSLLPEQSPRRASSIGRGIGATRRRSSGSGASSYQVGSRPRARRRSYRPSIADERVAAGGGSAVHQPGAWPRRTARPTRSRRRGHRRRCPGPSRRPGSRRPLRPASARAGLRAARAHQGREIGQLHAHRPNRPRS